MTSLMNTFSILSLFLPLLLLLPSLVSCAESQVYIVYLGEHEHSKGGDEININKEELDNEIEERHHSYLKRVKETEEEATSSLIYSYKNSINGFAATLTPHQASLFSEMKEVVSLIPSHPKMYSLHTTRSWEFAGLNFPTKHDMKEEKKKKNEKKDRDLLLKAKYGKDIIIGLLDSGVWPESTSFNDVGMGDIPKHWKGTCQTGDAFNSTHCNKKLIGARFYLKGFEKYFGPLNTTLDYKSPRDRAGHGTHTSSISAGRRVHGVSALGGFAQGTASGAMPHTRVAMYKVCWSVPRKDEYLSFGCWPEDLLAAIDDAIADGVNVLSISIGTSISIGSSISIQSMLPFDYKDDAIAIGALHATKKNIVVSCSAGNNGPHPGTLSNMAPWIITVGASSIDRDFLGPVLLGNGMTIEGVSASAHQLEKMYPLIYAAEAVNPDVPKNDTAGQCLPGSLSPKKAKGKIVVCLSGKGGSVAKGAEVKRAGGVGLILGNTEENTFGVMADSHFLPATSVNSTYLSIILEYINSTKNAMAQIELAETVLHTRPAPYMASFSSRGPNIVTPDILKPDITAPGINILAAWSEEASPTMLKADERVVKYNILSGTSMACPHVAGAAALLRAIHPSWSSAAIRSALITSAGLRNNEGDLITDYLGQPADPFQFGSGHFRPTRAVDPGLIYNASYTDYLLFLCKNPGPNAFEKSFNCTRNSTQAYNLNYPSLAISKFSINDTLTINRTVTNVCGGKSVYFASVKPPLGISVKVSPSILHFHKVGEEKSFTLTVKADREMVGMIDRTDNTTFGWYKWNDGIHNVRSPIAVTLVY